MDNETWLVVITTNSEILPPAILKWNSKIEHLIVEDEYGVFNVTHRRYNNRNLIDEQSQRISSQARDLLEAIMLMSLRKAADSGFVLYAHDSLILDACRNVLLEANIPFGMWFRDDVKVNWTDQHLLSCARIRFCFDERVRKRFRSMHVLDCEYFNSHDILPSMDLVASRRYQHESLYDDSIANEEVKKVLLISYYMPPAETVAVHRLNYWKEILPQIARERNDPVLEVAALTAVHSYQSYGEYLFVSDEGGLTCEDGQVIDLVESLKQARTNYFAAFWSDNIRKFFELHSHLEYDTIVLSGNPFFYFDLGEYFKKKWDAKIILDFRDPFANNPRFEYSDQHKALVTKLEKGYISNADYAISVNQYCLESLLHDDRKKMKVVANGFDERVVTTINAIPVRENDDLINFVYTGSFYADRDPEPFLSALDSGKHRLVHIGRVRASDSYLSDYPAMKRYGLMSYADVVGYCKSMDVGVIFTSGAPFEQTTKIFDYIASGISILIVTDGDPHTGELENLTRNLENIFWVKNNKVDIQAFLETFSCPEKSHINRDGFSRKSQTERLYDLISE